MLAPTSEQRERLVADLKKKASDQYVGSDIRAEEHAIASAAWGLAHRGLATSAAVLSAISGAAILSDARGGWRIVVGIVALLAATFSAIDTTVKTADLAEAHKRGADGFTGLRTKWLQFKDFTCESGLAVDELTGRFEAIVSDREKLTSEVPLTSTWSKRRVNSRRKIRLS